MRGPDRTETCKIHRFELIRRILSQVELLFNLALIQRKWLRSEDSQQVADKVGHPKNAQVGQSVTQINRRNEVEGMDWVRRHDPYELQSLRLPMQFRRAVGKDTFVTLWIATSMPKKRTGAKGM